MGYSCILVSIATANDPPTNINIRLTGNKVHEPHLFGYDNRRAVGAVVDDDEVVEDHGVRASSPASPWHDDGESSQGVQEVSVLEGTSCETRSRRTKATIRVASLNISGRGSLKDNDSQNKWNQAHFFMKDSKIGILAIQEAHMTADLHETLMAKYGRRIIIKYSSDPAKPNTNGVAFVLNKDITNVKNILLNEIIPGRALLLTTKWHGDETLRILNIYAPNKETENARFWKELRELYTKLSIPRPDVVLGDFNLVESEVDRIPTRQPPVLPLSSLRTLLDFWSLIDGWRERFPTERGFTYPTRLSTPSQSRLDRIYATAPICAASEEWSLQVTPITTDHKAAIVGLAAQSTPFIGKGRWSVHPSLLKDKKTMLEIVQKGKELQQNLSLPEEGRPVDWSPQVSYANFKLEVRRILRQRSKIVLNRVNETIKKLETEIKAAYRIPAGVTPQTHANVAALQERLSTLYQERHTSMKNCTTAKVALENETSSKFWSALNKEHKPRDIFFVLERPNSPRDNPVYEKRSDKMASLARDFYDDLQTIPDKPPMVERRDATKRVLGNIDARTSQRSNDILKAIFTREEVKAALQSSANGKASGLDGLPYEFWKQLLDYADPDNEESPFDPLMILATVFQDIHEVGLNDGSTFAEGWLCPIYKNKGDRRQISNYRPITLLNSDYKLMTKIIAARLALTVKPLIHPNQAGFVPGRSILDQIRLTELMFSYAEATEENGMIVALDQEKAYDRIDHTYLWTTLRHFNIPQELIWTIQSLYDQAYTKVVVNGEISAPFHVRRGVRQGDPMSCLLFDLAIEPLAATLRRSPLRGFDILGATEKLITTLFADDTTVYLSQYDRMEDLTDILDLWCTASTAKFNINKTKLIPIGVESYRTYVRTNRRLLPSHSALPDGPDDPSIVPDGEEVRILGAFLGNKTNQNKIWLPIQKKIDDALLRWKAGHPSLEGKRLILQYIVAGMTQYLTAAQGMPKNVENALINKTRSFLWDDRKPKVSLDILSKPIEEGGLGITDISARNEAIELVWLKKYLTFSDQRPMWALLADVLYAIAAGKPLEVATSGSAANPFLHYWKVAARAKTLAPSLQRMLAVAKKFNVNIYVARLANKLKIKLPAWYHVGYGKAARRIQNTPAAECLRHRHGVVKIEDLLHFSKRVRKPTDFPQHGTSHTCQCELCHIDTTVLGCQNPVKCLETAVKLLNALVPAWRPSNSLQQDNLSLTKRRKLTNREALTNHGPVTFNPTVTTKDLTTLFRISQFPATFWHPLKRPQRGAAVDPPFKFSEIVCTRSSGPSTLSGTYQAIVRHYPPLSRTLNVTFEVPRAVEMDAYLVAFLFCLNNYPPYYVLHLKSVPEDVLDLIMDKTAFWEENGWPDNLCGKITKQILNSLRMRSAPTRLEHNPPSSEETIGRMSSLFNQDGHLSPPIAWEPDLTAPTPFVKQGIALSSLSQASAYLLARNKKKCKARRKTTHMVDTLLANLPPIVTAAKLWKSLRHRDIRKPIRTFLWKATHSALSIGEYWDNIPGRTHLADCPICRVPETLEHIINDCDYPPAKQLKLLAMTALRMKNLDTDLLKWPNPLLCGLIAPSEGEKERPGATRLLRIILSETLFLTWKLRCERRVGRDDDETKWHTKEEATNRWHAALNARLHLDQLLTKPSLGKKRLSPQLVRPRPHAFDAITDCRTA